jgi:hypothetical protein
MGLRDRIRVARSYYSLEELDLSWKNVLGIDAYIGDATTAFAARGASV